MPLNDPQELVVIQSSTQGPVLPCENLCQMCCHAPLGGQLFPALDALVSLQRLIHEQ